MIDAAEIDKEEEWGTHRSARSHYQRRARTLITQDFQNGRDGRTYLSGMRMESLRLTLRLILATITRNATATLRSLGDWSNGFVVCRARGGRPSDDVDIVEDLPMMDPPRCAVAGIPPLHKSHSRCSHSARCRALANDVAPATREKTFSYEDKALAPHRHLFLLRLRRDRRGGLEGSVRPSAPNVDPDRVRAIVEPEAQKLGNKAVLFQAERSQLSA